VFCEIRETPTLVPHAEPDVRVPISQGYEFYNAFDRLAGVSAYAAQSAGASTSLKGHMDWLEKYLQRRRYGSQGAQIVAAM